MENQWNSIIKKLQEDETLSEFENIDEEKQKIIEKIMKREIDPEQAMDLFLKNKHEKK